MVRQERGHREEMKRRTVLFWALAAVSASAWAQGPGYPITVVAPGKGPYQFPQGYQTPWDKIEMLVTEKLAPNLYSLHGSAGLAPAHPDAAAAGWLCSSARTAC